MAVIYDPDDHLYYGCCSMSDYCFVFLQTVIKLHTRSQPPILG